MTNVPVMVVARVTTQMITGRSGASQIAIKHLGTNGGRILWTKQRATFREPDAADPTFWKMLGLIIIPAGWSYAFA